MKRYFIKCRAGKIEYLDVLGETDDGFKIRLYRLSDGNQKIIEESIPRHLFNICVKTGYLYESETASATVA